MSFRLDGTGQAYAFKRLTSHSKHTNHLSFGPIWSMMSRITSGASGLTHSKLIRYTATTIEKWVNKGRNKKLSVGKRIARACIFFIVGILVVPPAFLYEATFGHGIKTFGPRAMDEDIMVKLKC